MRRFSVLQVFLIAVGFGLFFGGIFLNHILRGWENYRYPNAVYWQGMRLVPDTNQKISAATEMGNTALVAIKEGGAIAICQTDGTGETAPIMDFAHPSSIAITTSFDLKKDSLPIVTWSLWHPVLARATGTLTVSTAGLSTPEIGHVAELLKSVAR